MTALGSLLLGVPLLFWLRQPYGVMRVRQLPKWALAGGLVALVLVLFPDILNMIASLLGRDATLTGRTDIWRIVLREAVDVIVGAGYQDFWQRPQPSAVMWEIFGHMNQAHNGYIETYLNGGVVGLLLLLLTAFYGLKELRRHILSGSGSFVVFLFAYLAVIMVYSWTEAIFNKISLLWFVTLLACLVDVDQSAASTNPDTLPANAPGHSPV
jgi:O-antigen ligase